MVAMKDTHREETMDITEASVTRTIRCNAFTSVANILMFSAIYIYKFIPLSQEAVMIAEEVMRIRDRTRTRQVLAVDTNIRQRVCENHRHILYAHTICRHAFHIIPFPDLCI